MRDQTVDLLERLENMTPLGPAEARTWFEERVLQLTNVLRWVGCSLFVLLVITAGVVMVWPQARSHQWIVVFAQVLGLVSTLCALAWIVLDTIPVFVSLVLARQYSARRQTLAAAHDLDHVQALLSENAKVLQLAGKWLETEIARINARIGAFSGSPDKLAFISLAGLGWSAWKETYVLASGWLATTVQFGLAFLCGGAIGCLFLRERLTRLAYQRDLLNLATSLLKSVGDTEQKQH